MVFFLQKLRKNFKNNFVSQKCTFFHIIFLQFTETFSVVFTAFFLNFVVFPTFSPQISKAFSAVFAKFLPITDFFTFLRKFATNQLFSRRKFSCRHQEKTFFSRIFTAAHSKKTIIGAAARQILKYRIYYTNTKKSMVFAAFLEKLDNFV